jgi:transcriptional regulator with XRE-family HTH domain
VPKQSLAGLGTRLANIRKSRGFTQEALEEASGVPRRTIQSIEHGESENPSLAVMLKLLNALRASFEDIGVNTEKSQARGR